MNFGTPENFKLGHYHASGMFMASIRFEFVLNVSCVKEAG